MSRVARFRLLVALMVPASILAAAPQAAGVGAATRPRAAVAQEPADSRQQPRFRSGEIIVKAARGRGVGLQRALVRANAKATESLGGGAALVQVRRGTEQAAAARLSADPSVAYAEPNYVYTASSHVADEVPWGVRQTRAAALWDRSITGAGVRVAIVDSGVDATHRQLANVVRGYDGYGGDGRDDCGHGTAVAGVVAAAHDGRAIAGVAPDATIVPVKVLRFDGSFGVCGGDNATIVRGIRWAASAAGGNADIINMSLGGPDRSAALRDAVAYAAGEGVLMTAASGNSGDLAINYPAAYPQVISVGGVQRSNGDLGWWPYSSFGSVDIAAPAHAIPVLIADDVQANRVARECPGGSGKWCADGTSLAAPHVAGVAALLHEQHEELARLGPGDRVRRARQWLLGTAPRVGGSTAGVDLKTGHGYPDAAAASSVSEDPTRTLLTWQVQQRVLSPTTRMFAMPASLRMRLVATTGTGSPLANHGVTFQPAPGSSVSSGSALTDNSGGATTTFRSTAAGRRTRVVAGLGDQTLAIDSYVLQYDDNVPGVAPPAPPFRGKLNIVTDFDDVFRFALRAGEKLRVDATEVDQRRERIALYLHRSTTRDVADPYWAPLREDRGYNEDPLRLSRKVKDDGVRYLDVYGYGSYRLNWWIVVGGRVRSLSATPVQFSPNGDGIRERTRLRWDLARSGRVTIRIRNSSGNVVRNVSLGRQSKGVHTHRWTGRNDNGNVVRNGTYRVSVLWRNDRHRRSSDTIKVSVSR